MATGAIQVAECDAIFQSAPFCVSKMASPGPNHLTAEAVCQSVCYSSRLTHRICDLFHFEDRCCEGSWSVELIL